LGLARSRCSSFAGGMESLSCPSCGGHAPRHRARRDQRSPRRHQLGDTVAQEVRLRLPKPRPAPRCNLLLSELAPVSWTLHPRRRRYPRCRERGVGTRQSTGNRWWIWSGPGGARTNSPASSSLRHSRSVAGCSRRTETKPAAKTALRRRSARSCAVCAGRYAGCARSGRSWQTRFEMAVKAGDCRIAAQWALVLRIKVGLS